MRKVAALIVITLLVSLLAVGCGEKEQEAVQTTEIPVEVGTVKAADVDKVAIYAGTLRGIEEATVYPQVGMAGALKVVKVKVQPGDRVSKGQSLMELDSSDVSYQVQSFQAQLDGLLARKDSTTVRLESAKKNLERTRFLFDQGAVAEVELEQIETEYQAALAGMKELEAGIAGAQASLDNARNSLTDCQVPSPISGVVGLVNAKAGDTVTAQTAVAVVADSRQMEVQVNVSQDEIGYIQSGRTAEVYVTTVTPKPFTGKITSVANVADARLKTYPVKIVVDNKDDKIKPGMFAEVHLATETKKQVLTVPRDAVAQKGARRVVYVVDSESVVHERDIGIGIENGQLAEVTKGLKAGEKIVVKGQTLIRDGDKVRIVAGGVEE